MSEPRVPGGGDDAVELPCGETRALSVFDLGMREYDCACGASHGVVTDVNPPERFLPEFLVTTLREAVETSSDEMPEFGTPHLMGVVLEEFPDRVTAVDASENPDMGYSMLWVTEFDSRRLHEIIVELVIELMEHAVSHADDSTAMTQFEEKMLQFDVAEFVDQYRAERDLDADDVYV